MHTHWAHVGRGAAGLGAAMGIGRFAYTPILPLMTTQAALTPQAAGTLATANYVGYLAGALAGTASPRLARSTVAWRVSLVAVVVTLAAMPLLPNIIGWLLLRTIADSPVRWCSSSRSTRCWIICHHTCRGGALAVAAVLRVGAWAMRGRSRPVAVATPAVAASPRRANRWFAVLFVSYTLEGIGYIIAGTFLVAAIKQNSSAWLGNGAWLFVGLAAAPSAALWAWLSARWSHPILLAGALLLQAFGIALPAAAPGAVAALLGAILFGATFHRGQHDGPGSRTPARIPRRRRPADYRLLRRADPGPRAGDTSSTPRLFTRSARRGAGRRVVGDGRRSASVRIPVGRCGSAAGSHASSSSTPNSGVSRVNSPITARTAGLSSP
jgi:Uncharacterised MFS-type transporter YbfB